VMATILKSDAKPGRRRGGRLVDHGMGVAGACRRARTIASAEAISLTMV